MQNSKKLLTGLMFVLAFWPVTETFAQKKSLQTVSSSSQGKTLTYDIGVSMGSYGGKSYTELNFGLNWFLTPHWNWRNAIYSRTGAEVNSTGLDSSMRYETRSTSDTGNFSSHFFFGPGVRISNSASTGVFAEGGASFRIGGFTFGAGLKSIYYNKPGTDSVGANLPNGDTTVFVILGGGGAI